MLTGGTAILDQRDRGRHSADLVVASRVDRRVKAVGPRGIHNAVALAGRSRCRMALSVGMLAMRDVRFKIR